MSEFLNVPVTLIGAEVLVVTRRQGCLDSWRATCQPRMGRRQARAFGLEVVVTPPAGRV